MLISLSEYANMHGKSGDTIRRFAESGALSSAQKIGRNWVVDSEECYPVKKRKTQKPLTVVSLFSGCGGMDLGLIGDFDFLGKHYDATGFKIIWANEINPSACKTYRENFGDYIIEGDIEEQLCNLPESADIVVGGFPCQDISINGKMLGVNGERSSLYTYIVEELSKKADDNVWEEMQRVNSIKSDEIRRNMQFYCAKETRERIFFVGIKKEFAPFTPPEACYKNPVTAYEALHDLEALPENKEFSHIWSKAKASGQQGNRKLIADRPGYTMRAECHGNIQFHYSLPRRMSMREAARIQSFPDSFKFPCGLRETERQIGNAVPPVLAWHIANSVKTVIEGK